MKILAAKTRNQLMPAFTATGKNALEIGVGDSSFSRIILESDPAIYLTAIDPFTDPEGEIPDFYDHDTNSKQVEILKKEFGERYTFIKAESPAGLNSISDESFDWIFVDGDHQINGVLADLEVAQRLCRSGGVIACHDFAVHDKAVENIQEVVQASKSYLHQNQGLSFYGIDLSVYPTSVLIKEPSATTKIRLDELLKEWSLYDYQSTSPNLDEFDFQQKLTVDNGIYDTTHRITFGSEEVIFETNSKRIFSGYYDNIYSKKC
jgi:hypothetical protein